MPTSTVKLISTLRKQEKSSPKWAVRSSSRIRLLGKTVYRLARPVTVLVGFGFVVLTTQGTVEAQTLRARFIVTSLTPAKVRVDLEFPSAIDRLSFRNAYGGMLGLGERIGRLEAFDSSGGTVLIKKLAPGEFQAVELFTQVNYDVNLTEPAQPAQMSHVSWLNRSHGLLLPADLLPQSGKETESFSAVRIGFEVPTGWTIASNLNTEGKQEYFTEDPDKAVFLIDPSIHEKSQRVGPTNISLIMSGEWPFSDSDAIKISRKIIEGYSKVTGFKLERNAVLMLIPFPGDVGPERWSAETRGNAVVLLLGKRASAKIGLASLGVVLSHELFHLWVPNSLNLEGDYDWFFEGFTLYQALRTALRLGLISFENYLATLARVYDSYLSSMGHEKLSLVEASERRWTTSPAVVYEKGMLVALIYDLSRRESSGCKASLDDVYSQLFRSYSKGHVKANETIIELLSKSEGMESFARNYVQLPVRVDLEAPLSSYGIQVQRVATGIPGSTVTKLVVRQDLNKTQRKLLRCLGHRG
jgi:predicted metalloprotease with PDZ domain